MSISIICGPLEDDRWTVRCDTPARIYEVEAATEEDAFRLLYETMEGTPEHAALRAAAERLFGPRP